MSLATTTNNAPTRQAVPELERLYKACDAISNEAFSAADLSQSIQAGVVKLSAGVKDAFRFITTWDFSKPDHLNDREIYRLLKQTPYTDLDTVSVYKPVGFVGFLGVYTKEIYEQQLPVLTYLSHDILLGSQKRFGRYLNDLAHLTERRIEQDTTGHSRARLEELQLLESKWLMEGNRSTEDSYTDLYQNHNDCYQSFQLINTINDARWNKANPKVIAQQTQDLVDVATALLTAIETNEQKVSPQVIKALAADIDLTARWVEWYSVMVTRIIDLTTAAKLTEKKLLRVL